MTDLELAAKFINHKREGLSHKDIDEFKRLLREGYIDPQEFLDDGTHGSYRFAMMSDDILIDEFARYGSDSDKISLIQLSKAENYYDDWRDHPSEGIRCALARSGYYLDYYLDDTINVRNAALRHMPEKMIDYVTDSTATTTITRYLMSQPNPDINLLEAHIEHSSDRIASIYGSHTLAEFRLKLDAMKAAPDTIHKTMTEEQLRDLGNPLWARPYSILEISNITNSNSKGL